MPQPPAPPPPPPNGKVPPSPEPPRQGARLIFIWIAVALIAYWSYNIFFRQGNDLAQIASDTEFRSLVTSHQVEDIEIVREGGGKTYVTGRRLDGAAESRGMPRQSPAIRLGNEPDSRSFTYFVTPGTEKLEEFLRENGQDFKVTYKSAIGLELLVQIIPVLLFFGLLYFLYSRQMRGGPMGFGRSRAHLSGGDMSKPKVTFANVAGVETAKEEVQEIIEFLKAPGKFAKLGAKIPRGVLLMGPPGTGKTLLAKAIAGEAGVPFFSISGSDFVEMFVGVGASRVRDMFDTAKKNSPCLIFIDEIDAVGRSRFTGIGGGHDEREQTLNALLVEMDGFESNDGVIVIAATNRPDVLDKALLRPGRFDRQIVVDLPTMEGRYKILKIHSKKITVAKDADLARIARGTPGFSGADLANLVNEAALHAASKGKEAVEQADFEEARDKVWWGRERPDRMRDKEEKRLTAYHEAGHAVVMALVKGGEPLHKITIIPRGMALGATMFLPKKDRVQYTRTQMLAMLATDMGGRAAEEVFLEDVSSGAQQDLRQATELAHRMVCDWGLSDSLGPRTFGVREEMMFLGREVGRQQDYSELTAQKIDAEVGRLVGEAHAKAREILESNRDKVELLVAQLLEKETIDGDDATDLIKFGRVRTHEERYPDGEPVDEELAKIDTELADNDSNPDNPENAKATGGPGGQDAPESPAAPADAEAPTPPDGPERQGAPDGAGTQPPPETHKPQNKGDDNGDGKEGP